MSSENRTETRRDDQRDQRRQSAQMHEVRQSASCPSYNEMDIKPHQFVSYVINEDIESLVKSKSLWKCLSCFACIERCPRDVKPGKLIDAARQIVVRERGQNYLLADEIPELVDPDTPQQLLVSALRRYRR